MARFLSTPSFLLPHRHSHSRELLPACHLRAPHEPSNSSSSHQHKIILPPRICTLRTFGKSPDGIVTDAPDERMPTFFSSLAANIEFSTKIQYWEILSGRLAMVVFASALGLEAVTGNTVFQKLDPHKILQVAGAFVMSSVLAAGFAVAWRAKSRVAYTVSKGYESLVNGLIDNVVDGLFFDDES